MFAAIFCLGAKDFVSLLLLNLFSSLLLSLQCISKFTALSCYCSMLLRGFSASMSFLLIISFIPLLNSSINSLSSYSFPLTTLLNSWTNSSLVFSPYSIFFNSVTFIILSSPPLNSSFKSNKNSPTIA